MLARPLLMRILEDEAMTRDLGDAEARVLVEWLVDRAEHAGLALPAHEAAPLVGQLCRRGRALARFVSLWGRKRSRGAALQLAACERLTFPLPAGAVDPVELMQHIVAWEDRAIGGNRAA